MVFTIRLFHLCMKEKSIFSAGWSAAMSGQLLQCAFFKTENLLVAGRCISTSREMNGSTRVMPCCFITGMAAGAAAAFSKDSNVRAVSVSSLRRELRKRGAYLPE